LTIRQNARPYTPVTSRALKVPPTTDADDATKKLGGIVVYSDPIEES
jgi:hypothetical protein